MRISCAVRRPNRPKQPICNLQRKTTLRENTRRYPRSDLTDIQLYLFDEHFFCLFLCLLFLCQSSEFFFVFFFFTLGAFDISVESHLQHVGFGFGWLLLVPPLLGFCSHPTGGAPKRIHGFGASISVAFPSWGGVNLFLVLILGALFAFGFCISVLCCRRCSCHSALMIPSCDSLTANYLFCLFLFCLLVLNVLVGRLITIATVSICYPAWLCWVRGGTWLYIEPRSQHLIDLLKHSLRYFSTILGLHPHVIGSHYFHVVTSIPALGPQSGSDVMSYRRQALQSRCTVHQSCAAGVPLRTF